MTYTIKITDVHTEHAKSLLSFLKALAQTKDYFFLKIEQEINQELNDELIEELNLRYKHFVKYKNTYKDWEDIKNKYIKA